MRRTDKEDLSQQGWPSQAVIDGMVLKNDGPMGFFGGSGGGCLPSSPSFEVGSRVPQISLGYFNIQESELKQYIIGFSRDRCAFTEVTNLSDNDHIKTLCICQEIKGIHYGYNLQKQGANEKQEISGLVFTLYRKALRYPNVGCQ